MREMFEGIGKGASVVVAVFVFGTFMGGVASCAWSHDRFDGVGHEYVLIRQDDNAEPLYICADRVNGKLHACLSAKEVAEAGRAKYRK